MPDSPNDGRAVSKPFQILARQADGAPAPIRIHVLGGFRIVVDGRELRLRTRKEAMVLLRLALASPDEVRRDDLVGMLWPDSSEARARHSLSEALRGIEQATGLRVARTPDALTVAADDIWLDLHYLDDALARGDVHDARRLLVGGFLAGWYPPTAAASHWVDSISAATRARVERVVRIQLSECRRATDSRGVSAAVDLLERLGAATHTDREAAAEAEQITGWETLRDGDPIPASIPIDREGPFVGRVKEMRRLTAELERALAGELRVVLIAGEAGIGKTRTCHRLARLAALRGARLFLSSCYELEQSVAFGAISEAFAGVVTPSDLAGLKPVWRQVLAEVLPGVWEENRTEADDQPQRPRGMHAFMGATAALFQGSCERRPGFLFVDDMQWADSTSCQTLHYLLRSSAPSAGALIVLAYRPEEVAINSPADLLIRNAKTSGGNVTVLGTMSNDEIREQLARLCPESSNDFAHILALACGNPFFARELALAEASSSVRTPHGDSLNDVVLRRVVSLPALESSIMQLLAVAAAPVPIAGLASTLQESVMTTARGVATLDRLRLTKETGAAVAVAHEITRNAIYKSLSESTRLSLHAVLATTLGKQSSSSFLAHHFSLAGMASEARRHAVVAAQESRAKKAFVEELGWLLLILQNSRTHELHDALEAVVDRMFALARYSEAVLLLSKHSRILDKKLKLKLKLARLKGTVYSADAYHDRIGMCDPLFRECLSLGMGTDAIEVLREKMRLAQEAGAQNLVLSTAEDLESFGRRWPNATEGAYARAIALRKLASYKPQAVREKLRPLLSMELPDEGTQAAIAVGLADALDHYNRGYVTIAAAKIVALVASARSIGDLGEEVRMRSLLVPMCTEGLRFGRAERHGRFVLEYARFADAHWESLLTLVNLAAARFECGDLAGARSAASAALDAERRQPLWVLKAGATSVQALCALEDGRLKEAVELSEKIAASLPKTDEWISDISIVAIALARVWRRQKKQSEAIALLEAAAKHARGKHQVCFWTVSLELARLRWAADQEEARHLAETVRHEAMTRGCRLVVSKADTILEA